MEKYPDLPNENISLENSALNAINSIKDGYGRLWNDHAYFQHDGNSYMVQQIRPESYVVSKGESAQYQSVSEFTVQDGKIVVGLAAPSGADLVTNGRLVGPVVEISGQFVVQSVGRGRLVAHECHRFDALPAVGDAIDLKHSGGKVSFVREQDKGQGNER